MSSEKKTVRFLKSEASLFAKTPSSEEYVETRLVLNQSFHSLLLRLSARHWAVSTMTMIDTSYAVNEKNEILYRRACEASVGIYRFIYKNPKNLNFVSKNPRIFPAWHCRVH